MSFNRLLVPPERGIATGIARFRSPQITVKDGVLFLTYAGYSGSDPNGSQFFIKEGDILHIATRNYNLVRQAKVTSVSFGKVGLVPFLEDPRGKWDAKFLQAIIGRRRADELYAWHLLNPEDLAPKLRIEVADPKQKGFGLIYPNELFGQIKAGKLEFGELNAMLPDGLTVSDLNFFHKIVNARQAVFSGVRNVQFQQNQGQSCLYIDASVGQKQGISYDVIEQKKSEPKLIEVFRQWQQRSSMGLSDVKDKPQFIISLINHEVGNLIVDRMEVENIVKVQKNGKKMYKLNLKQYDGAMIERRAGIRFDKTSLWVGVISRRNGAGKTNLFG
jgi:hypothetical protein